MSTSLPTRAGFFSANSIAMFAPSLKPSRCARARPECVHERGQIVGELQKRERRAAARRPAVAARIHRDGAKVRGKGAHLAVEVAAVFAVAVQEISGSPLAALGVVQHVRTIVTSS